MFDVWESLLQEVEVDSQIHADVAGTLNRQISRPLIEKTFYRKIQSRKVFTHRESFDTILLKTEDMLNKCRRDYSDAYLAHYRTQTNASLAAYFDAHNAYVQQLHATNGMLQEYNRSTLPTLLEELEAVYLDVSTVLADCILCGAHTVANRALEQSKRYESLTATCRSSDSRADVAAFVRCIEGAGAPGGPTPPHRFMPPHLPPPGEYPDGEGLQQEPPAPANLKDELILDRLAALSSRNRHEALKKEAADLERQIAQLQDSQETLLRIQQRNIEANLFNKVNEIQEDLSLKRFDLRVAQVHLSAVKAQKELFASKDSGGAEGRERKMSNSSGGSMKTKWMKAFKSLKTSEPSSGSNLPPGSPSTKRYTFSSTVLSVMANRKNCRDKDSAANFETAHIFQEYTYKKITACDVCHQILRGHSRQGLKCRMCKTNVHAACQDQVAKCQPKSRLLRRQRSTSEIEAKQMEAGDDDTTPNISFSSLIASQPTRRGAELPAPSTTTEIQIDKSEEVDLIYQVLKQAGDLGGRRSTHGSMERDLGREVGGSGASSGSGSATSLHRRHPRPTNTGTTLTVNPAPVASCSGSRGLAMMTMSQSMYSMEIIAPSSPVHNRRLLTTRNMRMSSVELPDENEKSLSSASTSPCPSPVSKKPHRLLPTNLYVVLYNFTSRHPDELDLRAGYKVTVIDTSDPDWWQGKCLGRTGYFPSKYVTRLNCGEKPLQVTHNLQVTDGDNGIKLLRDQIVIQIGEEVDGMVMIRNGDNQQGVCPLKYLQEA
ncbi:proto-oncogene vav isoform X11 [Macrobrachium rosenbergii]|uniref:proto-oncogene vav isoform X11 n=1 Tax=Macrobrachium rosenbergii TaxID=79674 RepID=UPI0034D441A0